MTEPPGDAPDDGVRRGPTRARRWTEPVALVLIVAATTGIVAISWVTGRFVMAVVGVVLLGVFGWSLMTNGSRGGRQP